MEFTIKTDNAVEAMAADYMKTIFELQGRCVNYAAEASAMRSQIEALAKERDALKPKEAPKLEAVPNPEVQNA